MSNINVYLAGPIGGCTLAGANDWRDMFSTMLAELGPFVGVSPLRCEPLIGDRYTMQYDDKRFGTPSAIQAKNFEDVKRCDVTVAYIPKDITDENGYPSVGTVCELSWAFALAKPRIIISDVPCVAQNAVVKATVPWIFEEADGFQNALDVIEGIFGIYSGEETLNYRTEIEW